MHEYRDHFIEITRSNLLAWGRDAKTSIPHHLAYPTHTQDMKKKREDPDSHIQQRDIGKFTRELHRRCTKRKAQRRPQNLDANQRTTPPRNSSSKHLVIFFPFHYGPNSQREM
jgi:hypothetical protein